MDKNCLSNLIIKKFISINTISSEAGGFGSRQNRNVWAIIIKFEGETIYTSQGENFKSSIDNIVLLPKGCDYSWKCIKKGRFTVIEFDADLTGDRVIPLPTKKGDAIFRKFKELEQKWMLKHNLYEMECLKGLYGILLKLLSETESYSPTHKQEKIRPALDYIAENFAENISNGRLAEILGISTVYFRKLFTETMGTSPINYIHSVRINKAKEILKSDYTNISVIAEMLGYSSIYHFSKMFKKYAGQSPAKFAKSQKQ